MVTRKATPEKRAAKQAQASSASIDETPTAHITVYFLGLMAVCVDRRGSDRAQHCEVYILDNAPGHALVVGVLKWNAPAWGILEVFTKPQIRPLFWLDVEGPGDGVIDFRNDFDKVVDLEGGNFYDKDVKVNMAGVYSTFHLNSGLFYTACESSDALHRRRGPTGNFTEYRKVATAIGVDINLQSGKKATFVNGERSYEFKHDENHLVIISQIPSGGRPVGDDAQLYFPTLAGEKKPKDRFHFKHVPQAAGGTAHDHGTDAAGGRSFVGPLGKFVPLSPPHAICFTAVLGDGPLD